jgi:ADP-ribosylglycohydrolase
LGTAVGDALGLAMEGMSGAAIARRFGAVRRFHLLGSRGFVSDDTEQSALVAQSLIRGRGALEPSLAHFRRALIGWLWRLPFGIGFGTLRACLRMTLGLRRPGVRSAGNGAAMRSPVIGAFFHDDAERRRETAVAFARLTHDDALAIAAAVFVADVAAACVSSELRSPELLEGPVQACEHPALREALERAIDAAREGMPLDEAARTIGCDGFVLRSVPFVTYRFAGGGGAAGDLGATIGAGGDTDTNAAIHGAWLGARFGAAAIDTELVERIAGGPFGPAHLNQLADALAHARDGECEAPTFPAALALARNLALYPVVIAHGLRRLIPF